MPRIWVGIGANLEPERHICAAIVALRGRFGTLRLSPVYRSTAVGFEGPDFLNLVVGFDSDMAPAPLIAVLRDIEDANGRVRGSERFSSRTLDLDLLLYGDATDPEQGYPADDITEFAHVLKPLMDINPEGIHPVAGETFAALWTRAADRMSSLVSVVGFNPGHC